MRRYVTTSDVLMKRLRMALSLLRDEGIDVVILGAYGCGVAGNDLSAVFSDMDRVLDGDMIYLKKAVFPIHESTNEWTRFYMSHMLAESFLEFPKKKDETKSETKKE